MEITLEMVERLREKTDVSYMMAKQALEFSNGNLLDALIYLEEEGAVPRPEGGSYSTRIEEPPLSVCDLAAPEEPVKKHKRRRFGSWIRRVMRSLIDNELTVWRKDDSLFSIPLLVVIALTICLFYIVIPLVIGSLFFGFRFHISGPDFDNDNLNGAMDWVADSAADMGRRVVDELFAEKKKTESSDENQ